MPPVLLVDLMDTLVVDPIHQAIPEFFGRSLAELGPELHPTAWLEFERGALSPEQYAATMFRDRRRVDYAAFEAHVRAAYSWIEGMQELVSELEGRGVPMHALSNYPVLYRVVDEVLGVSRYVELSFVSCHTHRRKPEPEAYVEAASALGRAPGECLFIDDRASNCRAAEAVGMPSIVFTDAARLRAALVERGVL